MKPASNFYIVRKTQERGNVLVSTRIVCFVLWHRFGDELKATHNQQLEELERRHLSELREVRERTEVERQAWEENILKRQESALMAKERELREQLRQERDKVQRC